MERPVHGSCEDPHGFVLGKAHDEFMMQEGPPASTLSTYPSHTGQGSETFFGMEFVAGHHEVRMHFRECPDEKGVGQPGQAPFDPAHGTELLDNPWGDVAKTEGNVLMMERLVAVGGQTLV